MNFKADVRSKSGNFFAGVFRCEVVDGGLRFSKRGKEKLNVPKGSEVTYVGRNRFSVSLPDRRFQVTVKKFGSYVNRMTRDIVEYCNGRAEAPIEHTYKMPKSLVLPCVLPFGIPILTLGGIVPAAIGLGFSAFAFTAAQREEWSKTARIISVWAIVGAAYLVLLLFLVVVALASPEVT